MRIAIPVSDGQLSMHFGHCEEFALIDVDMENKKIIEKNMLIPPQHEPGVLPQWLNKLGANVIISGGMGMRAQQLFTQNGIKVIVGAPSESPERVVQSYINGTLQTGENVCDH
jgi:predicted Fe-Mo cluster-binding NifX family protein